MNRSFKLPFGYHLVTDLVPLVKIRDYLKRNDISPSARKRLKWMDYYRKSKNVSLTCRYFGISRKTFYYWRKRYDPYNLSSLEEKERIPKRKRQKEITSIQEERVISLRRKYLRYSKFKLAILYQRIYNEKISSWKIQKIIEKYHLYYHPQKALKIRRKRQIALKKKRISELKKKKRSGFLIQIDTLVIFFNGIKRYIMVAIDVFSKIVFAHFYKSASSLNATDFLLRLNYLFQGKIENVQTDNGSEFGKYFERACQYLKINHYFSRVKTPKDLSVLERFNRTLKEEFLDLGNFTLDTSLANKELTEWLIHFNFERPHQALGYLTPFEFHQKHHKVLPMYSSNTISVKIHL